MSGADDELDACGCEPAAETPPGNRPGLAQLRWRAGTHGSFVARMLSRLPRIEVEDAAGEATRPLLALTTRASDDPALAILDAWAITGDILTFYTERIANEGYLRTATERRSVLELARAIGYELSPGVAASTHVAFTVEDPPPSPGALPSPTTVSVPAGTQVQSVPGQGGLPQTFETSAEVEARAAWNALRPRQRIRHQLGVTAQGELVWRRADGQLTAVKRLWLEGDVSSIKPGDPLAVRVSAANRVTYDPVSQGVPTGTTVVRVKATTVERPDDPRLATYTRVELVGAGGDPFATSPQLIEGVPDATPIALTGAAVRTRILARHWTDEDLRAFLDLQRWDAAEVEDLVAAILEASPAPAEVHRFRERTAVFGASAPSSAATIAGAGASNTWRDWDVMSDPVTVWTDSGSPNNDGVGRTSYRSKYPADLFLDRQVTLAPVGFALLDRPGLQRPAVFEVKGAIDAALADFAIAGKVTGLDLGLTGSAAKDKDNAFKMRTTTVHCASEALTAGSAPLDAPIGVSGTTHAIALDRMVLGLRVGQVVALAGECVDENGKPNGLQGQELATIEAIEHAGGYTTLSFVNAIGRAYTRDSLTICANVAPVNHGETVTGEPLGSGTAQASQELTIKRLPLTFISAATPSGTLSSLEVRVDGVVWDEVRTLTAAGPHDRVYELRLTDEGGVVIRFGDGVHGARLPTGRNNVVATYRTGIGSAGLVPAGSLALMPRRPLGLRAVSNPEAASGAQDPETFDAARRNAPLTVLTLDRVVSRRDFEDFARSFAGIGKAVASELWSGSRRLVHLTVASAAGGAVDPESELYRNLRSAIAGASDRSMSFAVDSYVPGFFRLALTAAVDRRYDKAEVRSAIAAALGEAFAFEARDLGQPVTAAEILHLVHGIEGVVAVNLDALHLVQESSGVRSALAASTAHFVASAGAIVPATLLLLQPASLDVVTTTAQGARA